VVTHGLLPHHPDPLDSSSVASSSKRSFESGAFFFLFSFFQPAAARFMSARRVRDYFFFVTSWLRCDVSYWVPPPLSSVSGVATIAPPKWPPRPPPLTRLRIQIRTLAVAATGDEAPGAESCCGHSAFLMRGTRSWGAGCAGETAPPSRLILHETRLPLASGCPFRHN
jgi:hypothetical protein